MQLFAFGINHNTAPLNIREQIAFPQDAMEHALHDLVGHQAVKEAAIVSTCNRTKFTVVPINLMPQFTGLPIFIICQLEN